MRPCSLVEFTDRYKEMKGEDTIPYHSRIKDGSGKFSRNTGRLLPEYKALQSRRG
jgi:hypothetical protein